MTILTEKPTLFVIARKQDMLEKHGETLRIRNEETKEIRKKVPALGIRDIVICGDVHIQSNVFSLAEKYAIPIHFLSQGGKFRAGMVFDFSKNVFLRQQQFKLTQAVENKIALAKKFVTAKVANQNTVLQKIRVKGRLKLDLKNLLSLEELRGKEGFAAKSYFEIWQKEHVIKNKDFSFKGRVKRPPTDPVNALLSFSFALLYGEIHTQLLIAGLDPFVGFLHEQSFGHAALASDFIEIFRGPVEHFILRCLNRKEFDLTDFEEEENGAVKLSRDGFQKFFPKWTDFLRMEKIAGNFNLTRLIEKDIRKFGHFLMQDEPDFTPFLWKK